MKVNDFKRIREKIMDVMRLRELDQLIGTTISTPVNTGGIQFLEYPALKNTAAEFRSSMASDGIQYSEDESIIAAVCMSILNESDALDSTPAFVIDAIARNGRVFREDDFSSNPYLKLIHFPQERCGDYELGYAEYRKREVVMYDDPALVGNIVEIPRIGFIEKRFRYPLIAENKCTWMSVSPNEICTMQKHIDQAASKVLTLGLGMGYYALMASEKESVESVTIVDKAPEVIKLFMKYILPQFPHKEKINIINADAFEYLASLQDGVFDYCFADTWKGNLDPVPYLKMRQLGHRFSQMKMSYWIEESMVLTFMGIVFMLILDGFYKSAGIPNPGIDEKLMSPDNMYTWNLLNERLKDVVISRPEQIDYFIDYRNVIKMI